MTVKLRFLYFYYVLQTTFELAKMISSAEQQNFLHHYQSLQFDSKLETGTPSEKADVVRKVLASLHSAKVTGRWVLKTLLHVFREKPQKKCTLPLVSVFEVWIRVKVTAHLLNEDNICTKLDGNPSMHT